MIPLNPGKIVGVGRNYLAHARELGNDVPPEPLIFLKPTTALLEPGGTIVLPCVSKQVEFEAEIGVVIGRRLRRAGWSGPRFRTRRLWAFAEYRQLSIPPGIP